MGPPFFVAWTAAPAYMQNMLSGLYNTEILSLSATLENTALVAPDGTARKVSKLCGSEIEVDVACDGDVLSDIALRVQACALGQASAAILKDAAVGSSLAELVQARDGLRAMLKAGADAPTGRFSKLALLSGVADYPARHQSTLLPFEAAVAAMEAAQE